MIERGTDQARAKATWSWLSAKMGDRLRRQEPLHKRSSLRIGGPAHIWAEPEDEQELEALSSYAEGEGLRIYPIGLGSNLLFPDEGIDGVVVRLSGALAQWSFTQSRSSAAELSVSAPGTEHLVCVGGGAINAHLVRGLLSEGCVGMEFLVLIPGTFGGAVAMNAGTKEQELSGILRRVRLLCPQGQGSGQPRSWVWRELESRDLDMRYRHASLPDGAIVVSGIIAVRAGDVEEARARVRLDKERRNQTQPYRMASVGSTFANPPGDYAGRLIEAAGLKGQRAGGARISELHANFFINEGEASSRDFLTLIATARHMVRRRFGVELRPEVQFVGFDGWQSLLEIERELEAKDCGRP